MDHVLWEIWGSSPSGSVWFVGGVLLLGFSMKKSTHVLTKTDIIKNENYQYKSV
jgi:hypothetical protein